MLKSTVSWMKLVPALATALVLLVAVRTDAQSLGGSPPSMNRQHRQARTHDFTFMESAARIRRFVASNLIVPLEGNSDYLLHEVSYPYARPAVQLFIERLSRQFRSICGETLTVTSLTRPVDEQPGNAHARSVHPTGMAVDLRVPRTQQCRDWLNRVLLSLEAAGVLEATRERSPAHYHVAVFPIQYEQYVQRLQSRRRSYVVQRGDALVRIARRTGTSVEALVYCPIIKLTNKVMGRMLVSWPDRYRSSISPKQSERNSSGASTPPPRPSETACGPPSCYGVDKASPNSRWPNNSASARLA